MRSLSLGVLRLGVLRLEVLSRRVLCLGVSLTVLSLGVSLSLKVLSLEELSLGVLSLGVSRHFISLDHLLIASSQIALERAEPDWQELVPRLCHPSGAVAPHLILARAPERLVAQRALGPLRREELSPDVSQGSQRIATLTAVLAVAQMNSVPEVLLGKGGGGEGGRGGGEG